VRQDGKIDSRVYQKDHNGMMIAKTTPNQRMLRPEITNQNNCLNQSKHRPKQLELKERAEKTRKKCRINLPVELTQYMNVTVPMSKKTTVSASWPNK
jgi:hypothetical protein